MESGEAPKIKGKSRKAKPVNTKIKINKRGSLVIPKVLVDSLEIGTDQIFEVKKTASGISLKIVKEAGADTEAETKAENTEN
jgi:hypothetical protein